MRSPKEQPNPIHLAIYVYDHEPPPDGVPVRVSLCPRGWRDNGAMTEQTSSVTCPRCRDHIEAIGVDWRQQAPSPEQSRD